MTQPHAAGALISTVDDLAKWDAALYTEQLVQQQSLTKAWTPFVMNNGKATKYGYGWIVTTLEGERMITHSGGINGFSCDGVRLPDSRIYVAILSNRGDRFGHLAKKIAARLAGKKIRDPVAIKLPSLEKYAGAYRLSSRAELVVSRDGDSLYLQHPQMGKEEIVPMSETEFFYKNDPASRAEFVSKGGVLISIIIRHRFFPDDEAKVIQP